LLAWDGRPVSTVGGVDVVIFEHSGHDPFIEEQQFFKRVLSDFLAALTQA